MKTVWSRRTQQSRVRRRHAACAAERGGHKLLAGLGIDLEGEAGRRATIVKVETEHDAEDGLLR